MPRERVGIMGGSFNPIHLRHIEMAKCAMSEFELRRVVFIPTGNPPHKHDGLADAEHRFEMTRLSVMDITGFSASRMELDREGVIYTVDTMTALHRQFPNADFFYIIGEDTMRDLPNWRKPDKVFTLCEFIVCRRETANPADDPLCAELGARGAKLHFLSLPPMDISSTEIRARLARGETTDALKPQAAEYIRMTGLYGVLQSPPGADAAYPKLRAALSDKRLLHSLLVARTARRLAELHHADPEQATLAGLLHDCAKCLPLEEMQRIARENRLLVDRTTMQNGNLLHGPVGAVLAERDYGVSDVNVLSAIRCHTTGKVGMLPLDMIIYLADKIEPSRRSYPALEQIRALADKSLIDAMAYSQRSTLEYVREKHQLPHPTTELVVRWLERLQH